MLGLILLVCTLLVCHVQSFQKVSTSSVRSSNSKLYENFGFDFAEDGQAAQPRELFGEVNYKNLAGEIDPNALLLGVS